jgi:hypothetical protein
MRINNIRENRKGNHEWTIQRTWQHWVYKTQEVDKNKQTKNTTQYVLDTTMHKQTPINVNKTWVLVETTGGKDELNIVFMWTSQHGTQNVKTFDIPKSWTSLYVITHTHTNTIRQDLSHKQLEAETNRT